VNAVAPGVVDTHMHRDDPKELLTARQPMGQIVQIKDIVDAIVYLTEAGQVTGEVLHVDGVRTPGNGKEGVKDVQENPGALGWVTAR